MQTQIGLPVFGHVRVCGVYAELGIDQIESFGANSEYKVPDKLKAGDNIGIELEITAPARLKLEFPAYTGDIPLNHAEWVEVEASQCRTQVSDLRVVNTKPLPISMGWLCLPRAIAAPGFELHVLRDLPSKSAYDDVCVGFSFARMRKTSEEIQIRCAIGSQETRAKVPAGGIGFSPAEFGAHGYCSIYLERPLKSGTILPVTLETSDTILFRGSVLGSSCEDFRPAFELVRLNSSIP